MDEMQKLAAEQFANIEVLKFMLLDLWNQYLHDSSDPGRQAIIHRDRQINHLQMAVDEIPNSTIRHALLGIAEENWRQIFNRLEVEGINLASHIRQPR